MRRLNGRWQHLRCRLASVRNAIYREKQLKDWLRKRKVALIESVNPMWEDLAAEWFKLEKKQISVEAGPTLRSG